MREKTKDNKQKRNGDYQYINEIYKKMGRKIKGKEKMNQRILIPCKTRIESVNEPSQDSGAIIKGKLITCNNPTRNGIAYTKQSMERFVNDFTVGKKTLPFLDSHTDDSIRNSPPFGHITKLFMNGDEVFYEANVDPEEKTFLHKLKRGDISEVSLQAIVDAVDEEEAFDGNGTVIADVKELLEISSVLIPGAKDTTSEIQEECLSEKRFVETFRHSRKNGITFKESLKQISEVKDNNELVGGQIRDEEEDLDTGNGDSLYTDTITKKTKSAELFKSAQMIKIQTWTGHRTGLDRR